MSYKMKVNTGSVSTSFENTDATFEDVVVYEKEQSAAQKAEGEIKNLTIKTDVGSIDRVVKADGTLEYVFGGDQANAHPTFGDALGANNPTGTGLVVESAPSPTAPAGDTPSKPAVKAEKESEKTPAAPKKKDDDVAATRIPAPPIPGDSAPAAAPAADAYTYSGSRTGDSYKSDANATDKPYAKATPVGSNGGRDQDQAIAVSRKEANAADKAIQILTNNNPDDQKAMRVMDSAFGGGLSLKVGLKPNEYGITGDNLKEVLGALEGFKSGAVSKDQLTDVMQKQHNAHTGRDDQAPNSRDRDSSSGRGDNSDMAALKQLRHDLTDGDKGNDFGAIKDAERSLKGVDVKGNSFVRGKVKDNFEVSGSALSGLVAEIDKQLNSGELDSRKLDSVLQNSFDQAKDAAKSGNSPTRMSHSKGPQGGEQEL